MLIEEAKKRIISDTEKKQQEDISLKLQEEQKKNSDPTYALMMRMEQMMASMSERHSPIAPGPIEKSRGRKKAVVIPEPEPEKPKRKVPIKQPKPIENVPKRKKKIVYLQQDPIPEQSTQFVGYDIAPPAEPIQYQPSSGLLSAMMGRRNMNSYQY